MLLIFRLQRIAEDKVTQAHKGTFR
jgi:hypothetical protein